MVRVVGSGRLEWHFSPMCFLESRGQEKEEQVRGVTAAVDRSVGSGRLAIAGKGTGEGEGKQDGCPRGVLTVVRLQSVGMCGCVAGVAGAALEAVVVLLFLLAVADAVHAVRLARSELHALDVHLCTQ